MKYTCALFLTALLHIAIAQDSTPAPQLRVGDPAPALACGQFIQGEPVAKFDAEHTYIVEFWATWCGPCKATIPHLNALQQKFKDRGLIVIGQNSSEPEDGAVEPFVKQMGDQMTYRVALDDKRKVHEGSMQREWMVAAQQQGIPCAFVVGKDQKLAWVGHPAQLDEKLLEQILAGTYDAAAEAKAKAAEGEQRKSVSTSQLALNAALRDQDWTTAEQALSTLTKSLQGPQQKYLNGARLQILVGQQKLAEASTLAEKLSGENRENVGLQYQLGSALLNTVKPETAQLVLAEQIARAALEKAEGASKPVCQALVAKALMLRGKQDEAVKLQAEAMESVPNNRKAPFQKVLDAYKDGKMPSPEKL